MTGYQTIQVWSDRKISIGEPGETVVITVLSGGTVYYGDPNVSASSNRGALTSGQSTTVAVAPVWVTASAPSMISLTGTLSSQSPGSHQNQRTTMTTGATAGALVVGAASGTNDTANITKVLEVPVPLLNPGGAGSANTAPPPAVSNPSASSFIVTAQFGVLTIDGPPASVGVMFNLRAKSDDTIKAWFAFWGIKNPTQFDIPWTFIWPYIPYSGEMVVDNLGNPTTVTDLRDGSGYNVSLDVFCNGSGSDIHICNTFLSADAGSMFVPAGTLQSPNPAYVTAGNIGVA